MIGSNPIHIGGGVISHGSLFTGLAGFDLAAERNGFENKWNCDINPYCRTLIKQKYPNAIQYTDVRKMEDFPFVDIMSGGFPCQDISDAKTHDTNGTFSTGGIDGVRSGLWWEYLRIIERGRPSFIVAENVQAITRKGLGLALRSLSDIGYFSEWATIAASQFGAPHSRKRTWIVAYPHGYGREQESIILSRVLSEEIRQAPEWELSRTICKTYRKKTLPEAFGVYDGIPRGVHDIEQLTALGNAVVPQIPTAIFKVIREYIIENNIPLYGERII